MMSIVLLMLGVLVLKRPSAFSCQRVGMGEDESTFVTPPSFA